MHRTTTTPLFAACALALGLAGCGDDKGAATYIRPWSTPFDSLQVGQSQALECVISQGPADKLYVDVDNQQPTLADVNPLTQLYKAGETSKSFMVKAKAVGQVTLIFRIRDTTESKEFKFTVRALQVPDGGA